MKTIMPLLGRLLAIGMTAVIVSCGDGGGGGDTPGGSSADTANLSAEAKPGSVTLTWNDTGASSYNLYYASAPNCNIASYTSCPGGTMVANVTSPYTVTGLNNGQNYWFKVGSEDTGGNTISKEAGARPDRLVVNRTVAAIAHDAGGTTYLGGFFTRIGTRTGFGVPLSPTTGKPGAFPMVNGPVLAAVSDGAGGYYVGGDFFSVGDVTRNGLAHILADGSVDIWNPGANGLVTSLAISGGTVYVGGTFTTIGGQARNHLAAINTDGTLAAWNPDANGVVSTLAVSGSTVYAGGNFLWGIGDEVSPYFAILASDPTITTLTSDLAQ